ncbi:MAG: CopG family transcriptional regulator [Caulobacter sp.]|nr:CopG family transcriptional regulator [Caulobacter sp.]
MAPKPTYVVKAVNLRVREDIRDLIDLAADSQGRSRSDFMIEASRRAAEEALLDKTFFGVSEEGYNAIAQIFDGPPQPNERLRKMLRHKPVWEQE